MATDLEPIARGTLQATPFAHLLLSIKTKALTGTLALSSDNKAQAGEDKILFRAGEPVAARYSTPAASFERGLLAVLQRHEGDYAFYAEDLVTHRGDTMQGRVRLPPLLLQACRAGVRADAQGKVLARLGNQRLRIRAGTVLGDFGFDPEEMRFVNFMRAAPADADALINDSGNPDVAKRVLYVFAITRSIEKISSGSRPAPDSSRMSPTGTPFTDPPLGPKVSSSPSVPMAGGRSISPLQSKRPSSPGSVSASRTPQKPKSTFRPGEVNAPRSIPPEPPPGLSPDHLTQWKEAARYIAMMDKQNYFDMLGVKESSSNDDISRRYLMLAKRWHPDRLPTELEAVRPWVGEIFHWLTTARDTLLDPQRRKKYLTSMASGSGTPEEERKVSAIVEAAMTFQKVQVLMRQRKWEPALLMLDDCLQISPQDPDYHAMRASLLFMQHGTDNDEVLKDIELSLTNALNLNRNHVNALLTKAQIYKRLGDENMALGLFKKVVDIEPKNIDAIREVRLANMRRERSGGKKLSSKAPRTPSRPANKGQDEGFLGKLMSRFKKS